MNEQCAGCPWLDGLKKQCQRTPPRFCSVDEVASVKPAQESASAAEKRNEPVAKVQRAA
jgi:hypothetical protein